MKKIIAVMLASISILGSLSCVSYAADNQQPYYSTVKALAPEEAELMRERKMYLNYLNYALRLNWKNPEKSNNYKAGFNINIDKNGRLISYEVAESSKSEQFEKSALQTLLQTAPFKPIPAEAKLNGFNTQVLFNGQGIWLGDISNAKHLKNKVSQSNKVCRTVEINESKQIGIQSEYPQFVSSVVHSEISKQIQQNWKPFLKANSAVAVSFKIGPDGTMQFVKVDSNQTQNADAADAAVEAVKAVRLSKVPDSSIGASVEYYFVVGENIGL